MNDPLSVALDTAWSLLADGAANRHSPIHTPVVSTVDPRGHPDSRILVLRTTDRAAELLRFHTDARSPKLVSLAGRPVHVLAYDATAAVQLRISGTARIETATLPADAVWSAATPFSRRCYLAESAPGTPLPGPGSGLPEWVQARAPSEDEVAPARANFALILVAVTEIDWLHLARTGHRRARFAAADGWRGEWLTP